MNQWTQLLFVFLVFLANNPLAFAKVYDDPKQVPNPTLTAGTFIANLT